MLVWSPACTEPTLLNTDTEIFHFALSSHSNTPTLIENPLKSKASIRRYCQWTLSDPCFQEGCHVNVGQRWKVNPHWCFRGRASSCVEKRQWQSLNPLSHSLLKRVECWPSPYSHKRDWHQTADKLPSISQFVVGLLVSSRSFKGWRNN